MNMTTKSTNTAWMHGGLMAALLAVGGCSDDVDEDQGDTAGPSTTGDTTGDASTAPTTTTQATTTTEGTTASDDGTDSGTTGDDDDGSTTAADDTGSTGDTSGITLSGTVTNLASGDAVEGVSVCVHEHPDIDCTTTNAQGVYALDDVPVGEGAIVFEGGGVFPGLFHGITPDMNETLNYFAINHLAAALLAAALGEEIDPALGHVGVWVVDANGDPLPHVSFEMTPASGAGPGYITPESSIDPQLTETTEVGFAGWVNVDPGAVQITASHPTLDCTPHAAAIVGDEPDAIRMDVTAGYLGTTFPFVCA